MNEIFPCEDVINQWEISFSGRKRNVEFFIFNHGKQEYRLNISYHFDPIISVSLWEEKTVLMTTVTMMNNFIFSINEE
jgi:hypothetical protein